MRIHRIPLLLAALTVAWGCGDGKQLLSPDGAGPRLAITSVSVICPDTISVGQTSQCQAYAYDGTTLVSNASITWSTTTPSLISVSSTGAITGFAVGSAVVQATAGGVTGSRGVYVKPGLTVSIGGPGNVKRWDDVCTWSASVSGGTPPYSYAWNVRGGFLTDYGSYVRGYLISASMFLDLTVTDAYGVQKTVTREIKALSSTIVCH